MTPRALLSTGLGLLLLSLVLAFDGSTFRTWLSGVLSLVGSGLVVVAALVSALQRPQAEPVREPEIDHYA